MEFIMIGSILLTALLLLKYCFISVPPKNYAIFNLLGWRWRKAKEGLTFIIPFFEDVRFYSDELDRLEISVSAISQDALGIEVSGALEFRPDYDILFQYDQTRVNQAKAISDSVKDEIGILAGTKTAEAFFLEREAIQTIINCRLRLAVMPHREEDKHPEVKAANGCIAPKDRIDFYNRNLKSIQDNLRKEKNDPRRSHIEESYGIDAKLFNLTKVEYGKETKAALEARKQAALKGEAAKEELKLAKSFMKLGVNGQEAVNAAQTSLGKAKKDVHSFEGKPVDINVTFGGENERK